MAPRKIPDIKKEAAEFGALKKTVLSLPLNFFLSASHAYPSRMRKNSLWMN
jgi:hypothetical protein